MSEQSYRYDLLSCAKSLYAELGLSRKFRGLAGCCSRHNPMSGGFFGFSIMGGSVVVRGRNHCHNRACCPVCSYPRQRRMMSDICHGIWTARHNGHGVYLVTLTFSHGIDDDLGAIQYLMASARQSMYRQGGFRSGIRALGYFGRIVDYEVQLLGKHGPHPHTHELFFADAGLSTDEILYLYDKYWIGSLYDAGLSGRVGVACKVTGYQGVGDYITKMGSEVCLSNFTKESWGGGSMSPMRVLQAFAETGETKYADAWIDYITNIRCKRIIGFSRGLRGALGLADFSDFSDDDSGLYDGDLLQIHPGCIEKIPLADWYRICEDINHGELEKVLRYLKDIQILYDVKADGLNKYNGLISCLKGGDVEELVKMVKTKRKG